MAIIISKGPVGTLSGRVGNVVVSKWRDKDVARKPPTARIKKKNQPESEQNLRLGLVTHFLSPFKKYIRLGYPNKANKNPGFQMATQYNLNHAVTGEYPNFKIDYTKAVFSQGSLDMAWGAKMELVSSEELRVSWEVPETSKMKLVGKDIVCFLVYSEKQNRAAYFGKEVFTRAQLGKEHCDLYWYAGETLHGWIFFVSPDGKNASNTRYIGSVEVPERQAVADLQPSLA